jgi:hypothetical protein
VGVEGRSGHMIDNISLDFIIDDWEK